MLLALIHIAFELERGVDGHLTVNLDGLATLISCLLGILELFRHDWFDRIFSKWRY